MFDFLYRVLLMDAWKFADACGRYVSELVQGFLWFIMTVTELLDLVNLK